MNARRIALMAVVLVGVGAAVFGWFRFVVHPNPVACGYCRRPLRGEPEGDRGDRWEADGGLLSALCHHRSQPEAQAASPRYGA